MPYVKLFLLSVAFVLVVYFMYFLNTTGIENTSFGTLIGAQKPVAEKTWKWCESDISTMHWKSMASPSKNRILKKLGNEWRMLLPTSKETTNISPQFNAWLKNHCSTSLLPLNTKRSPRVDNQLKIQFINGQGIQLQFARAGKIMSWKEQVFKAEGFYDGLLGLFEPETQANPVK